MHVTSCNIVIILCLQHTNIQIRYSTIRILHLSDKLIVFSLFWFVYRHWYSAVEVLCIWSPKTNTYQSIHFHIRSILGYFDSSYACPIPQYSNVYYTFPVLLLVIISSLINPVHIMCTYTQSTNSPTQYLITTLTYTRRYILQ